MTKFFRIGAGFLIFAICFSCFLYGQDTVSDEGIRFESHLSWEAVKAKARAEKKYIFLDCYTTWCGPCKLMDRDIYPQKQVGDVMNQKFICVKVQMDKTPEDGQEVRAWYDDAAKIKQAYRIHAFPTFLFFSPEGEAVHKTTGAAEEIRDFLYKVTTALNPETQNYSLLHGWMDHREDSVYLFRTLSAAKDIGSEEAGEIEDAYLHSIKNPFTKETIGLISKLQYLFKNDKVFALFLENRARIDELMGRAYAEGTLDFVIFREEIAPPMMEKEKPLMWNKLVDGIKKKYPALGSGLGDQLQKMFENSLGNQIIGYIRGYGGTVVDWGKIRQALRKQYPDYDFNMAFLEDQARYYHDMKVWPECTKATFALLRKYGNRFSDGQRNDMIWENIFLHCDDRSILNESLQWIKQSVARVKDKETLDTYANLLYKTGALQEAIKYESMVIEWEEKEPSHFASELVQYKINLEKMKTGEPTWEKDTTTR